MPYTIKDIHRARQSDVAVLLGVTTKTIGEWSRESDCPRNLDRTYDLAKVIPWHIRRKANSPNLPELSPDEANDPDIVNAYLEGSKNARDRLLHFKAERERLALARDEGELVAREAVRELLGELATRIREAGEILQRNHGQPAAQILHDLLDAKEWNRLTPKRKAPTP